MKKTEWADNLEKSQLDPTKSFADKVATSKHIELLRSDKTLDQIEKEMEGVIRGLDIAMLADQHHIELAELDYNMGKITGTAFDLVVGVFYYHNDLQRSHGHFMEILQLAMREGLIQ